MKQNIEKVKYNEQATEARWTWDEFCDRCGFHFRTKNEFQCSHEPKDKDKKSYCLNCLNILLDEKIKEDK